MLIVHIRDPGRMTSSSRLHPLALLALLLAARSTSTAPTQSNTDQRTPSWEPRSTSQPSWHLLLALWRPRVSAPLPGEVENGSPNMVQESPPTGHSPSASPPERPARASREGTPRASREGTPRASRERTSRASSEGTTRPSPEGTTRPTPEGTTRASPEGTTRASPEGTTWASPEGTIHSQTENDLLLKQVHATRYYPSIAYVPRSNNASELSNAPELRYVPDSSNIDESSNFSQSSHLKRSRTTSKARHVPASNRPASVENRTQQVQWTSEGAGNVQHVSGDPSPLPATVKEITASPHTAADKEPHYPRLQVTGTLVGIPEVGKQTHILLESSVRVGTAYTAESSRDINAATTMKTSVEEGREVESMEESQDTLNTHETYVVAGEVMSSSVLDPANHDTADPETIADNTEGLHPAIGVRQVVKHISSEVSKTLHNSPDHENTMGLPQPDAAHTDEHFFMHPLPQLRESVRDAEETSEEHLDDVTDSESSFDQTFVVHPHRPFGENSRDEALSPHHSERGHTVLQFQGPVVMESLDEPSLVPLVGQTKEILTLKDDEKAILALLKVAQNSNTLEDPFQVNSIIQNNNQATSNIDQLYPTISFLHENDTQIPADESNPNAHRTDYVSLIDENNDPRVLKKKDSKSLDARKSVNAINVEDKADVTVKDSSDEAEIGDDAMGTTAKPIYEEISDTLKVDTSIDDVEDFDLQLKHTENTDDFLPTTNQSHPNFIDVTLHVDHQSGDNTTLPAPSSTVTPLWSTVEAPPAPTSSDFSEYPVHYPPKLSVRPDVESTPTTEGDTDGWSVFVANITGLNSTNVSLNESVFQKVSGVALEEHYKLVLHERGSLMLQLMDPAADPCHDFYQFACGRWNGKFPIRQDKAVDNTFERLKEDLDDVLRSLLEEPPLDDDNNITTAVKTLYAGCMNTEAIEALDAKPLLDLLKELGGWPVLEGDAWNDTGYDWVRQMARLRNYNNDILISEWVAADITNSSNHIIQLDQPELGLPGREYFINPGDYQYREAYLNLMLNVTQLLGASIDTSLVDMADVLQFEKQISRILTAAEERRNLSAVHRRMTVEELSVQVPEVDWRMYLETITWRNNNTQELVVFGLDYFRKLVDLINDTDDRVISNYLLWRFVKNRISNLGERYIKVKQDYIKVLFGRKSQPERWRSCVTYVSGNLGYVVGAMFVKRYFPEASKNDTHEMISLIRDSFKEALEEARWMNEETRTVAQDKVDTIVKNVGYPEYLLNSTYMDAVYYELSFDPATHFDNVLKMLQFHARTNHDLLAVPVNRTAWVTSPAVVNAYYSRSKNMIVFPAGILQPPFYHPAFPRSLNYGGIGVVIGHEITHGFDDRGRQFDKNGNLQQWWTPDDVSKFYQRASCMLDQYGEYKVDDVGLKINPVNTLGENIADNAGIKISYQAYQTWRRSNEETVTMPFVNLTHDQLFFLNFGQIWCEVNSPEAMLTKIRSGQHSPNRFRVIGTLSNSEEFSQAFNCPVGSKMNPERKCRVW